MPKPTTLEDCRRENEMLRSECDRMADDAAKKLGELIIENRRLVRLNKVLLDACVEAEAALAQIRQAIHTAQYTKRRTNMPLEPLYQRIVGLVNAIERCRKSGSAEWEATHTEKLDELCEEALAKIRQAIHAAGSAPTRSAEAGATREEG